MFSPLKILIISPEVTPFAKTGGLADVCGALPKALRKLGCDVRVILPLYKCVTEKGHKLEKIKSNISHKLLGNLPSFDLYESKESGFITYFIDYKKYFDREELYGTSESDYSDNAYRFSFFSKAALAAIKAIDFKCNIIHCNDWQSALVPFYLRYKLDTDNFYKDVKTLFTIHNLAYQGQFPKSVIKDIDIPAKFFNMHALEFYDKVSFMKSGILYSDEVSTVSKGYAKEILTVEYGCGLEGVLKTREDSLFGITNGADYADWNPEIDPFIKERYDSSTIEKKLICKKDLLEHLKMRLLPDRPLLGVITRLAWQKGMDLLANIVERLVASDIGIVVLGKGDEKYQTIMRDLSSKHPEHVSVNIKFDNKLAHQIEAGSDIFLMPSRYEPCGLNQMYSLRYGTIPVVRATGGLDDVIIDFDKDKSQGNGFKFELAKEDSFYDAVKRAIDIFSDRDVWRNLVKKVMQEDFSWDHSAKEYISLYEKILQRRAR